MTYSFCEALLYQHSNYPDEAYQIVTPETTFLTPLKTQLDSVMRSVNALLTVFVDYFVPLTIEEMQVHTWFLFIQKILKFIKIISNWCRFQLSDYTTLA